MSIIVFVGGVGSGKSVSVVREMLLRNKACHVNFRTHNIGRVTRLKVSHIVKKDDKGRMSVNYDYWKEQQPMGDIYIDEVHNLVHSRAAMSSFNRLASMWVSQIRKVLGQDEHNHLYLITQKPQRLDVAFRDLTSYWVHCSKKELSHSIPTLDWRGNKKNIQATAVVHRIFDSLEALNLYDVSKIDQSVRRRWFLANRYFKYYDSYRMVEFGSEEFI